METPKETLLRQWAWTFCLLLAACAPHKVAPPTSVPARIPDVFSQAGHQSTPQQWWQTFDDDVLNAFVTTGIQENLELRAAWQRLRQFEALAIQAGAARQPQLDANAGASRQRSVFLNRKQTQGNYNIGLTAGYEVDVWNRLQSLERAGLIDAQASREDAEAIAWSLSATIARTWFGLVATREQLRLLDAQLTVNQKLLQVLERRFANGLATAVDVYQQRDQLAATTALQPPIQAQHDLLHNQLAVLLGMAPGDLTLTQTNQLPTPPPLPATGVPAELLANRPDLRGASLRIRAADYRLGAAIADRYPSLRLTASTGLQANQLRNLLDSWVWNLAANLVAPLLDGGRRKAEVTRQRAVLEERLLTFEQTYLTAVREVEDALVQERQQLLLVDTLQERLELSQQTYERARNRYLRGIGDFFIALNALQAMQQTERQLVSARSDQLGFRINLHQALGGSWSRELTAPEAANEENP